MQRLLPVSLGSRKRTILFAEHLTNEVFLKLPRRQFVFTLPNALRPFFRHDRSLFTDVSQNNPLRTAQGTGSPSHLVIGVLHRQNVHLFGPLDFLAELTRRRERREVDETGWKGQIEVLQPDRLQYYRTRCIFVIMKRTQVQVPDSLYRQARRVAESRDWSVSEVFRRALEQYVAECDNAGDQEWSLPEARPLGSEAVGYRDWRDMTAADEER